MKKRTIAIVAVSIVAVVLLGFVAVHAISDAFKSLMDFPGFTSKNWANMDLSVTPIDHGTYWETEDGCFSYQDDTEPGKGTLGDDLPCATLRVDGQEHKLAVYFSSDSRSVSFYDQAEWLYFRDENRSHQLSTIETWEAVEWTETDTQVIINLRVVQTTHFAEGQIIRLIHNKK